MVSQRQPAASQARALPVAPQSPSTQRSQARPSTSSSWRAWRWVWPWIMRLTPWRAEGLATTASALTSISSYGLGRACPASLRCAQAFDVRPCARPAAGRGSSRCQAGDAHHGAETLVVEVVGAQRVAVQQQRRRAGDVDARCGSGSKRHAGGGGEVVADQEVAVAGQEEDRGAAVGQRCQRGADARR